MGKCRISGKESNQFMAFKMPLAGSFLETPTEKNEIFPLTVEFCEESGLVQVAEDISPEKLFSKYMYKSGAIKTLVDHFHDLASKIPSIFSPKTIVDIGCNDFSFLRNFTSNSSIKVIGIDPSDIALRAFEEIKNNNTDLFNTFFNKDVAKNVLDKYGSVDLIYSSNCFAHISDIKSVAEGISNMLSNSSIFICEVHWLGSIINNMQFPFIYHEHIFYYSLKSISYLLNMYDIDIYKVEYIPMHGGSIRYYCCKKGCRPIESSVLSLSIEEEKIGLYNKETFDSFAQKIYELKKTTKDTLLDLKNKNLKVAAYGASGQANTFLSYYDLDNQLIPYIIDDSPLKINRYTSSGLIPIKPSSFLYADNPDYILCLAYTFFDEIYKKHQSLGSKWIIPLPKLRIV